MVTNKPATGDFPSASATLESFGLKFTPGGPHISRTMMLTELGAVLANVPLGSSVADYRAATLYDQYSQLCREEALPVQIASAAALGKKMKASGYENLKARDGMKYGLRKKKLVDDPPAPDLKAILAAWDDDKASGEGAAGQCVTV